MRHRSESRYEAVDLLRACAALSIVAFHTSQFCGFSFNYDTTGSVFALLKIGVTVFFVISGFVLYLPYTRAIRDRRSLPDWRQYAGRRALRILPAYYLALVVCTAAGLGASTEPTDWWRYLTLTETYKASTLGGGLGVAWSLCIEIAFYILLPFLARVIARMVNRQRSVSPAGVQLAILGALAGGTLLLRYTLTGNLLLTVPSNHIVAATSLPYVFDWFAIGMALATVAADWESGSHGFRTLHQLSTRPWLSWLIAGAVIALVVNEHAGDIFLPQYDVSTHLALGLATAFFVLPALSSHGLNSGAGALRKRSFSTLGWLGTVSYGIYLWHMPVLRVLMRLAYGASLPSLSHPAGAVSYVVLLLSIAGGATALGAASWYLLEQPLQRRLRRNSGASSGTRSIAVRELASEPTR